MWLACLVPFRQEKYYGNFLKTKKQTKALLSGSDGQGRLCGAARHLFIFSRRELAFCTSPCHVVNQAGNDTGSAHSLEQATLSEAKVR